MKTKPPSADHRNRPIPPCDRCRRKPGEYRWVAATRYAEGVLAELRLCSDCLQGLRSFLAGYENKIKQRTQAAMAKSKGTP